MSKADLKPRILDVRCDRLERLFVGMKRMPAMGQKRPSEDTDEQTSCYSLCAIGSRCEPDLLRPRKVRFASAHQLMRLGPHARPFVNRVADSECPSFVNQPRVCS